MRTGMDMSRLLLLHPNIERSAWQESSWAFWNKYPRRCESFDDELSIFHITIYHDIITDRDSSEGKSYSI